MSGNQYEEFVRSRITELRIKKDVSEHRMSLDLDKSGAYIRGITSGANLPSLKELFRIISYFDMTPAEFFAPTENRDSLYLIVCEKMRELTCDELKKISTFIDWIDK